MRVWKYNVITSNKNSSFLFCNWKIKVINCGLKRFLCLVLNSSRISSSKDFYDQVKIQLLIVLLFYLKIVLVVKILSLHDITFLVIKSYDALNSCKYRVHQIYQPYWTEHNFSVFDYWIYLSVRLWKSTIFSNKDF